MKERLQKLISSAGLASRRAAEELIKQGRVKVNGETASLGMSADPELDDIRVNGKRLRISGTRVYIMLNKPRGYVTTLSDEKGRKTVAELVKGAGRRLYPVGRLDLNSEGLLIMTDDGEAANALMHPSHEVGKTYRVTVSGREPEAAVRELEALREEKRLRIQQERAANALDQAGVPADFAALLAGKDDDDTDQRAARFCAAFQQAMADGIRQRLPQQPPQMTDAAPAPRPRRGVQRLR